MCGDCLWMRYGENLDECGATWTCPVCRDICNCSNAGCLRASRDWPATGILWKHIQGRWQSAAHYLVMTRQRGVAVAAAAASADVDAADVSEEACKEACDEACEEACVVTPGPMPGPMPEPSREPSSLRVLPFRAAKAAPPQPASLVGTVVLKAFGGDMFYGEVVQESGGLFRVVYDDNDREQLTREELMEVVVTGAQHEAARKEALRSLVMLPPLKSARRGS